MSLRVTDVLPRFDGAGDITVWLKQAKLAKDMLKLEDLAVVIPLFLDGDAFAVYDQLHLLQETLESYNVDWSVELVPSQKNMADVLTRVPKNWRIKKSVAACTAIETCRRDPEKIAKQVHGMIHRGVEATLHFSKKADSEVTREIAQKVVDQCDECRSIDPHPICWPEGELSVDADWDRLAIDVTHANGSRKYLTVIDCGPSRFALWREIKTESDAVIVNELRQIFSGFGPPKQILCDNGKSFRSKLMAELCRSWGVKLTFRCVYRPSGNGIIERHHRTIKAMQARTKRHIQECVFWYNVTPRSSESLIPAGRIFAHEWRNPFLESLQPTVGRQESRPSEARGLVVGDRVWVKPVEAKCTTRWKVGRVTKVCSSCQVEVDGIPRHVRDLRKVTSSSHCDLDSHRPVRAGVIWDPTEANEADDANEDDLGGGQSEGEVTVELEQGTSRNDEVGDDGDDVNLRRSVRERRPPGYLADYETFDD